MVTFPTYQFRNTLSKKIEIFTTTIIPPPSHHHTTIVPPPFSHKLNVSGMTNDQNKTKNEKQQQQQQGVCDFIVMSQV